MRLHSRLAATRNMPAAWLTGRCPHSDSPSASNNKVKPLPGRAHGTSSCVVLPHEVHLTLGTLACSHASNWKKSRCRHCLSTRSCMPCSGAPHCGQASRCVAQVTVKSMRRLAVFRSTSLTDHGACNPRAAVNKVSTPPFIFCPPHQAATIALRGMGAEVKFHSKWHRAGLASCALHGDS